MKKISVILSLVMLFAIGSAFTTVRPSVVVSGEGFDNGTWYTVNTEDVGETYQCIEGPAYCLYQSDHVTPLPGQPVDEQFQKLPIVPR